MPSPLSVKGAKKQTNRGLLPVLLVLLLNMDAAIKEINDIREIIANLPVETVREIRDFAFYLADRDARRKALVERVLKAEKDPDTITCHSAEEFLQAIESADDND